MTNTYDALIIGAGQAGPPLAGRLTAAGMSVALIERKLFGGTCVNTGCIPTKTLIASAYAAHLAGRAENYGVSTGAVAVDMRALKARKDAIPTRARKELFERYQRSEKALVGTLAEMDVQGVSTRKVKAVTEALCGHSFSARSIGAINKSLDESLKAFSERRLSDAANPRFVVTSLTSEAVEAQDLYVLRTRGR